MHHTLSASRNTLHGRFSADARPAIIVDSGDTVSIQSIPDVSWGLEPPTSSTAPRRKVEPRDLLLDDGPCMCGPIAVRNARPDDTLEIQIEDVVTGDWGWTFCGNGIGRASFNSGIQFERQPLTLMSWSIDRTRGFATNNLGHRVAIRPFPGTIGLASTQINEDAWAPRACGGNMDCRELIAGSTLFLPVLTDDALLSVGDGHAAQGDGELAGSAIECALEKIQLRVTLRTDLRIRTPRIRFPNEWITLGFGETLDAAAASATSSMLELMQSHLEINRNEALALSAATVDLRITQIANPLCGVHAVWKDVYQRND